MSLTRKRTELHRKVSDYLEGIIPFDEIYYMALDMIPKAVVYTPTPEIDLAKEIILLEERWLEKKEIHSLSVRDRLRKVIH